MPPRTRGSTKTKKVAKENIGGVSKPKVKLLTKEKNQRKPLADKTNSASDENSPPQVNKDSLIKENNKHGENSLKDNVRPRRERILPKKYKENNVLKIIQNDSKQSPTKVRNPVKKLSPLKTPQKEANSLVADRPKRVCRLPSRFNDHSVSPNKFIPVGCIASTPIMQNKSNQNSKIRSSNVSCNISPLQNKCILVEKTNKKTEQERTKPRTKTSADTNNNAKAKDNPLKIQKALKRPLTSPINHSSCIQTVGKKILPSHFTIPVVDEKKSSIGDNSHLDVYEFTFDPNEEPPPKKKKPKRTVKKRPTKPKTFVIKYNYDKNVSKALAALKDVVTKKPLESHKNLSKKDDHINDQHNVPTTTKPTVSETSNQIESTCVQSTKNYINDQHNVPTITKAAESETLNQIEFTCIQSTKLTSSVRKPTTSTVQTNSHTLTRVEEIEADFDCPVDHDIDYSPVASPNHGNESYLLNDQVTHNPDPLNLQENISFFNEAPVASSSMNVSVRRPHDSPWRVEFDQLPIKWHVNTYVKPNMTPAVECSFINFDDNKNKKKHVYTDMVPESNCEIPELGDSDQSNLKQTSIISFFRDRLEKSARKKKRAKSVTPVKANSVFEDVSYMSVKTNADKTPQKTPMKESTFISDKSGTKGNVTERVTKMVSEPPKSAAKDKDGTYFGFDESEDQENVSPIKIVNPRVRALRPRGRAVLQEINALSGPTRANIPLAAKPKIAVSSEAVNKAFEEFKSATDAPVFPETHTTEDPMDIETQNEQDIIDDDSQSVHLFEDIEVVHHLKPSRKSYGKSKKVTFQTQTTLDAPVTKKNTSDSLSGDDDDLADITFNFQDVEKRKPKKKVKKKQLQSKKEKAEMEAWAAQFNSMCEDVEEFPLVVE